ncbi:neuronal acetylcholine receptor subunit alpha-10-like [Octopus vulgaris]|uniref:Neuronal acetylcholine receptor subunit alpha-10-like n=1 Tax=Octopus vulgaris TaxID=6645 RepID=A0AA36BBG6_OCTVU|nr:neuronal acetylcholine receptor subunit alpha-10-like [Octopus vulgaris]
MNNSNINQNYNYRSINNNNVNMRGQANDSLQILHTSIWIRMQWNDCRLSWNKTDFEDIDQILVSNKEVWIPDIALYENSISLLGFLLPPSSGEKVSIGVTVLLSLSVFLLVVNQTLPANSDEIPYIGIYFASCMMLVSLSCVMAVITVNIHYKSSMGTTFPAWMEKLQQSWFGNIIGPKAVMKNTPETLAEITRTHSSRVNQFNPKKESSCHRRKGIEGLAYHNSSFVSDGDRNDDEISSIEKNETTNMKEHDSLIETLELFLQYLTKHDSYMESTVGNKWKLFALFLDRTFMITHIITFILTTAALLILCAYF